MNGVYVFLGGVFWIVVVLAVAYWGTGVGL